MTRARTLSADVEGMYNWWRSSGRSKARFICENRDEIDTAIRNVTEGRKPAHYLAYGPDARS